MIKPVRDFVTHFSLDLFLCSMCLCSGYFVVQYAISSYSSKQLKTHMRRPCV